jgi:hypothetical protein
MLQTDNDINYLAKLVEQFVSKPHLDPSVSAKNTFFVKIGNFDQKGLNNRKRIKKKSI